MKTRVRIQGTPVFTRMRYAPNVEHMGMNMIVTRKMATGEELLELHHFCKSRIAKKCTPYFEGSSTYHLVSDSGGSITKLRAQLRNLAILLLLVESTPHRPQQLCSLGEALRIVYVVCRMYDAAHLGVHYVIAPLCYVVTNRRFSNLQLVEGGEQDLRCMR
jgi:hypothetical protein